ncbi:MAG: Rrf2 family transcriptional regulator [Synechococcaceae cyanobacterium]
MAPRRREDHRDATAAGQASSASPTPRFSLGASLLGRQDLHALKALMVLAEEPQRWCSVAELAARQELPAALLEQQLLRLRRAGLLQARRGRTGGYCLAAPPQAISLAAVLQALRPTPSKATLDGPSAPSQRSNPDLVAADQVAALLESRLRRSLNRELNSCTLADLMHDLRSARAVLEEGGGWLLG